MIDQTEKLLDKRLRILIRAYRQEGKSVAYVVMANGVILHKAYKYRAYAYKWAEKLLAVDGERAVIDDHVDDCLVWHFGKGSCWCGS